MFLNWDPSTRSGVVKRIVDEDLIIGNIAWRVLLRFQRILRRRSGLTDPCANVGAGASAIGLVTKPIANHAVALFVGVSCWSSLC